MQDVNWVALTIFVVLFAFITWLGFAAAHWRKGDLDQLHEWGLGGRRFGTVITWFLVGGDLYTAYTFIAVPALAFGAGAIAFFAVPYTILIYPILFLVFPRLWYVCRKHDYITAADFVRGRFGNRWLALAVTITGIVATMPYIALQLVGLQVVIGALGVHRHRLCRRPAADHRLRHSRRLHLFERAARAGLDRDRQGHADLHHRLRRGDRRADPARRLRQDLRGGAAAEAAARGASGADTTGAYGVYVTLALGSALALFLYPHSHHRHLERAAAATPSAATRRCCRAIRSCSGCSRWSASSPSPPASARCRNTPWASSSSAILRGAGADPARLPVLVRRHRLRRHRHRRPGAGRDHVDRRGQSLHPQHPPRIHQQEPDRQARSADGEMVSLIVKFGALLFIVFAPTQYAIQLQLLGGIWIIQTLPSVMLGVYTRWFNDWALFVGWAVGTVAGTAMALRGQSVSDLHHRARAAITSRATRRSTP